MVDEVSTSLRLSVCETLNRTVVVRQCLRIKKRRVVWDAQHVFHSSHGKKDISSYLLQAVNWSEARYGTLSDQGTYYVTSGILTTSEVVGLRGYDHEDVWSFIMY